MNSPGRKPWVNVGNQAARGRPGLTPWAKLCRPIGAMFKPKNLRLAKHYSFTFAVESLFVAVDGGELDSDLAPFL